MYSGCRELAIAAIAIACSLGLAAVAVQGSKSTSASSRSATAAPPSASVLRVCADPNNLPFSNTRGQGFENALAEYVAARLGRSVQYTWWPQRRGFIRNTLRAGSCDVVIGVPKAFELARTTRPYYRSSYVFVSRRDRGLHVRSFDDPALARLRVGVHVVGDDYNNVPPAEALAARGLINNVRGYSIYGDYSKPDPPRALVDAVAAGDIDIAVVWGPLAGYFGTKEPVPLDVIPVEQSAAHADPPMTFEIAMGVRKDDAALGDVLDRVIADHASEIDALLARFGVPRLKLDATTRSRRAGRD